MANSFIELSFNVKDLRGPKGVSFPFPMGGAVLNIQYNDRLNPELDTVVIQILADAGAEHWTMRMVGRLAGDDVSDNDWGHWIGVAQNKLGGVHLFEVPADDEA